jgi:hypothetical protein
MGNPQRILPNPGAKGLSNLNWLVCFLSADIPAMSLADLNTVLGDIRHMAKLAISDPSKLFGRWEVRADENLTSDGPTGRVYREARLRDDLSHYQVVLKRAITELTNRGRTVLHISTSINRGTVPLEIIKDREHPGLFVQEGTIDEVFLAFDFRMVFVLQSCVQHIRVCARPDCPTVFLQTGRSDQEYCPGKSCGDTVRMRRWRQVARYAKHRGITREKASAFFQKVNIDPSLPFDFATMDSKWRELYGTKKRQGSRHR